MGNTLYVKNVLLTAESVTLVSDAHFQFNDCIYRVASAISFTYFDVFGSDHYHVSIVNPYTV